MNIVTVNAPKAIEQSSKYSELFSVNRSFRLSVTSASGKYFVSKIDVRLLAACKKIVDHNDLVL